MELKKDLFFIGSLDPNLRTFDIIVNTDFGTSYNAYLLKGTEKNALVETVKANFMDEYFEKLEKLLSVDEIDYLVLSHMEPDHSGSVEKLIDLNPNITIVASVAGINFLKAIVNREFKSITVKDGDTLSLGDKTLEFMPVPNLHWPDTIFTYYQEGQVLFTCDAFGTHYCHLGVLRSNLKDVDEYLASVRHYFDSIMAPFKDPFIKNALKRIEDLDIKMIATGHGPVIDSNVQDVIDLYKEWVKPEHKSAFPTVAIVYVSAYGYTKQLAMEIAKGVSFDDQVEVKILNLEDEDIADVLKEVSKADGVLLGSPTFVGEALKPIWDLATSMTAATFRGRLGSAFGSFGWSGEAVDNLLERLKQMKMKVLPGYKVRFKPSSEELKKAFIFGSEFSKTLLENKGVEKKV